MGIWQKQIAAIPIAEHAAIPDAHHEVVTLADVDSKIASHAAIVNAHHAPRNIGPYAGDETVISETSTTFVTRKSLRVVRDAANLFAPSRMIIEVEAYIDTAGQTLEVGILVAGTSVGTLSFTETAYTRKVLVVDVTGWADGIRVVDLQMRVTGGTGYNRLFEVYFR